MISREVTRLIQQNFLGKIKCCLNNITQYFKIFDTARLMKMESLKIMPIIRYGEVLIWRDVPMWAYAVVA